jgi:glucosamine-6-phosphate deaminase
MKKLSEFKVDSLQVEVYPDGGTLANAVALEAHQVLKNALARQSEASVILATGNSQIRFLEELIALGGIDWHRTRLFHMDEYLGLSSNHPASFGYYMRQKVESKVKPRQFHYLNGETWEPMKECSRYAQLLNEQPVSLCCLGIGENGHLAFNDPPVADFEDPHDVKVVRLDDACKMQQVREKHFQSIKEVPPYALTLTLPRLCRAERVICICPETRKAEAVFNTLKGPISASCPASFLRRHGHAKLFLDAASAAKIDGEFKDASGTDAKPTRLR